MIARDSGLRQRVWLDALNPAPKTSKPWQILPPLIQGRASEFLFPNLNPAFRPGRPNRGKPLGQSEPSLPTVLSHRCRAMPEKPKHGIEHTIEPTLNTGLCRQI